ncbi:MAG: FtsK/SpoIIIE domain-containing protein, partial [Caldilineaceae bacterium]
MNIKAAATQLENGIRQAFVAEKIGCHIIRTKRGPRTLTTGLRLYDPDVKTLARVGRMGPAIEARAGVSPVRIHSNAGIVYVESPSPEPVAVYANSLAGEGLLVPLGMTTLGGVAGHDFDADSHLLAVAPTNGGKSTALKTVLYHLARQLTPQQARFVVCTFKPVDWAGVSKLAHTGGLITDVDEAVGMIKWLAGEMYRRTNQHKTTPHLFVVLDDLLNILSRASQLAPILAEIASLGRGAGIHLIVGTQRLGKAGMGDAAVAGNITARIVFRTVSAQDAALFTGRGDSRAEALGDQPGDALLITTPGGVQRVAVALTTDED